MLDKVLKSAKILQSFTFDEILSLLECSSNKLKPIIKNLEKKRILIFNNNKYFYIKDFDKTNKKTPVQKTQIKIKKINKIYNIEYLASLTKYSEVKPEELFYNENDILFYKQAYSNLKKRIIKYLQIFSKTTNMDLEELEQYLKLLKEEHPILRFKVGHVVKIRDKFLKYGLKAFETDKVKQRQYIPNNMYNDFKNLYLYSKKYSLLGAYNKLQDLGYNPKLLPCYETFKHCLYEDYTKQEINDIRNKHEIIPLMNNTSFNILNNYSETKSNLNFKDTAIRFLESMPDKSANITKRRARHINTHLLPYFENCIWSEITTNKLKEFIVYKSENCHYANNTIREILFTLFKIKNLCVDNFTQIKITEKRLSNEEIQKLYDKDWKSLLVVATGFTESELLGLRYEDINFKNGLIHLKYIYQNKQLHKINKPTFQKKIIINSKLLDKIPRNKTGIIFETLDIKEFDILINTHVALALEKNIPITIIAKRVGITNLNNFYKKYHIFMQKDNSDDVLANII